MGRALPVCIDLMLKTHGEDRNVPRHLPDGRESIQARDGM